MDAIEFLTQQHLEVTDLFDALERVEPQERNDALREVSRALKRHAHLEERIFYPSLRQAEMEGAVENALDSHERIDEQLANLAVVETEDDAFLTELAQLRNTVERHLTEEEEQIFPWAIELLGLRSLQQMGKQLAQSADDYQEVEESMYGATQTHPLL